MSCLRFSETNESTRDADTSVVESKGSNDTKVIAYLTFMVEK